MTHKILIVDDDRDTLRLVGMLLQRKGYQILAANRGVSALEKAAAENPDLILLDIMMPDMDGYEIARRLRAGQRTESIPIIMFTAKTQVDDRRSGFEAGADDYLTKPTHPSELLARVQTLLARTGGPHQTQRLKPQEKSAGSVCGILAAKGGVGVSTVAVNLAAMLQQTTEQEIIVADLRPGNGGLSMGLGYHNNPSFHMLLEKDAQTISANDINAVLVRHRSGLKLLPASYRPSDAKYSFAVEQYAAIIDHLTFMASQVLLDLGPGLPPTTLAAIDRCDRILVILEPVKNTVLQTKALLDDLSFQLRGNGKIQVVVVNKLPDAAQISLQEIGGLLGITPALILSPAHELAAEAAETETPLVTLQQNSLPNQQYQRLAQMLVRSA